MELLELNSLLWGLLVISTTVVTEANTLEDVQVKLYNISLRASHSETQKTLKKADRDLESHGFNREISTTKLVKEPGSYEPEYQESYFYYKTVNCSRTQEIERELDTLIPDIFADEATTKLKKEKYISHLGDMRQCKIGLELIIKKTGNHYGSKKASPQPKTRRDMDKIEAADEGGFRVNSGIGVGKTINNIWGSRRRRRNTIPNFGSRRRRWGR